MSRNLQFGLSLVTILLLCLHVSLVLFPSRLSHILLNHLRSNPISERYRLSKNAREWLVNLYPSSNGRQKHLAVAGVMAVMPQRELTGSKCSRRLSYCVSNHVNEDKMCSWKYLDVDVACGNLMLEGLSVAFWCGAFHGGLSRQNAFNAMKSLWSSLDSSKSAVIPKMVPTEFASGARWHHCYHGS